MQKISRRLGDFKKYLYHLEQAGLSNQYALIGGMATEFYRRRYMGNNSEEIESKDVDFIGGIKVAECLKSSLSSELDSDGLIYSEHSFPLTTGDIRRFEIVHTDGLPLYAESLSKALGIYNPKTQSHTGFVLRLPFDEKLTVSVMDPVTIYTNKLAILAEGLKDRFWDPNIRPNDAVHRGILKSVIPSFLSEYVDTCQADDSKPDPRSTLAHFMKRLESFKKDRKTKQLFYDNLRGVYRDCKNTCVAIDEFRIAC